MFGTIQNQFSDSMIKTKRQKKQRKQKINNEFKNDVFLKKLNCFAW